MSDLTKDEKDHVNQTLKQHLDNAFDNIYVKVELDGEHKPSCIARYLKNWGLDDYYREWWESDPEESGL